jgi:8-oxo-dGTP pyrophosphatase MutT (NUDIX family)
VQRELQEEAGRKAAVWRELGKYLSSPGIFTEVIHLFMAQELTAVDLSLEAHEVIEVHWKPFDEALAMAHSGEIADGKTLVGLYRAAEVRKQARSA